MSQAGERLVQRPGREKLCRRCERTAAWRGGQKEMRSKESLELRPERVSPPRQRRLSSI